MTNLLLKLFVKNSSDTENPKVRTAIGKLSGLVGIVCNILLFAGKLAVGLISGSVSVTADAMNNLTDASGSIVTLLGFRLAEIPPDADHPYGHARFEYLSGLAVAAMIVVIGFELAKSSVTKIFHPSPVAFSGLMAGVLLGSVAVKLWLSLFNGKLGKKISSATLNAAAQDSRNDVLSTAAVLAAALIQEYAHLNIDGYVGLGVALLILWSGASLAKETISPLLGEAASPELQALIVDYISHQEKVLGYHDLMVHDYGPGQRFASIHVEMDTREDPLTCHELIDDMERECLESHNIHLVIHYDPVVTNDPELNRLRKSTQNLLTQMDSRLKLHDFRLVKGCGHTNLIFDISLPGDMDSRKAEIREYLEKNLSQQENTHIYTVITFDSSAFNALN